MKLLDAITHTVTIFLLMAVSTFASANGWTGTSFLFAFWAGWNLPDAWRAWRNV